MQRGGGNPPGSYVFFATLKTDESTVKYMFFVFCLNIKFYLLLVIVKCTCA